jgi:hypothetical protein
MTPKLAFLRPARWGIQPDARYDDQFVDRDSLHSTDDESGTDERIQSSFPSHHITNVVRQDEDSTCKSVSRLVSTDCRGALKCQP